MKLNALLMCREPQSARVLTVALDELQIAHELCASTPEALEVLAQRHYSALLVDFDVAMAEQLARLARMAPAQRRPVVFAIIGALTNVGDAFQSGANFVLYKPLVVTQVLRSLRTGRVFMRPDRRRSSRANVEMLVYLRFGDLCAVPALVLNLSERGLAVQAAEPLPAGRIPLRFILPGTAHLVEGEGEIIWADEDGRAGILFNELPERSARELRGWLAKYSLKESAVEVTVHSHKSRNLGITSAIKT